MSGLAAHPPQPAGVPVFNCVVNVARSDAEGAVVARVANLAGIEGHGKSEREALGQAVAAFKAFVAEHHAAGRAIPWRDPPLAAASGEAQRLIAVHL
jgi:hypothetical protein